MRLQQPQFLQTYGMHDFVIPEQIANRLVLFRDDPIDQADRFGRFNIELWNDPSLVICRSFVSIQNGKCKFLIKS